jgi:2-oxoglutarate dehydrogenase E2 component (dihydrolipoamide succinyltransferase)
MATEIVVPEMGESVLEATVLAWHKQPGDPVKTGDVLVELETDKVNIDVSAMTDGVLGNIEREEGEDVAVGDVLGVIAESAGATAEGEAEPQPEAEEEEAREAEEKPAERERPTPEVEAREKTVEGKITPVARRLAEERGVDVDQVQGTGPAGRVTKEDVAAYLERQAPAPERERPRERTAPERRRAPALPAGREDRRVERVRMSRRRRTIAERLVEAQRNAAMLTTFNDVDMSGVMALRRRRKEAFQERHGVSLGISSFFVRASVGALKGFPRLNAEIDGDEMILKHYFDIGVAIGAEEGLVVPVLRDADRMSFAEIEQAIKSFAQKAREGSLSLEDLRGGTFTITNGGVFGSLLSTPILNPPQVGILGLHRIEDRPMVYNGEVVVRPMMYLALSYDHRIVDGREAVQFLGRIKELIENPEVLLLEG